LKLNNVLDVEIKEVEIKSQDSNGQEKIIKTYKGIVCPINKQKLNEAENSMASGYW
jgi:hypothetical protein